MIGTRKKILLGGYETWVELRDECTVMLFGFETATVPLTFDVMGDIGHKKVNGFISSGVSLTEQEKTELNNHINQEIALWQTTQAN